VLEVAVQPDERSVEMAADWAAAQDAAVFLCFDAHRFAGQRRLIEALTARCERLIVATIGNSADVGVRARARVRRPHLRLPGLSSSRWRSTRFSSPRSGGKTP
jgi:hypothetical protein